MIFPSGRWCLHHGFQEKLLVGHAEPARRKAFFFRGVVSEDHGRSMGKYPWGYLENLNWKNVNLIELDVPWLVVQCAHLEKWWSSSMGFGWHPIYEMEHSKNVWNHQPVEFLVFCWTWCSINLLVLSWNEVSIQNGAPGAPVFFQTGPYRWTVYWGVDRKDTMGIVGVSSKKWWIWEKSWPISDTLQKNNFLAVAGL